MKVEGDIKILVDNDKYIDFLCHCANEVVERASRYSDREYLVYNPDESTEYFPWAQKVFDAAYDDMESHLNHILNIYPNIKFADETN